MPLSGKIDNKDLEECFNKVYYDFVKTNTTIALIESGNNFRKYRVGDEYYHFFGTFHHWAKTFLINADDNGYLIVKFE